MVSEIFLIYWLSFDIRVFQQDVAMLLIKLVNNNIFSEMDARLHTGDISLKNSALLTSLYFS
jgi:hypothetical protein